jgi:hypothetical protein
MSSPLTNAEKLQVFNQDRSVGSTYADHTALLNPSAGGRFAREATTTIVKGGPDYPRIPGPWSEPCPSGDEPSLGYAIGPAPDLGEPPCVPTCADTRHNPAPQIERTFRRRI